MPRLGNPNPFHCQHESRAAAKACEPARLLSDADRRQTGSRELHQNQGKPASAGPARNPHPKCLILSGSTSPHYASTLPDTSIVVFDNRLRQLRKGPIFVEPQGPHRDRYTSAEYVRLPALTHFLIDSSTRTRVVNRWTPAIERDE